MQSDLQLQQKIEILQSQITGRERTLWSFDENRVATLQYIGSLSRRCCNGARTSAGGRNEG